MPGIDGMKHSVEDICIFILVLFLTGCGGSDAKPDYVGEVSPYAEMENSAIFQLHTEEPVISTDAEKMVFYVTNQSDQELLYGHAWYLEVLYEETWHRVPFKLSDQFPDDAVVTFSQTGVISRPGKTTKELLSFEIYDYEFKSGTYRWVQYVSEEDKIMVLEFRMAE